MENKIALYRKYRPTNFDQVYGQKVIVKSLESAIKNNEITHSYIFAGNKGSGKTTLAKIFSKAINCLELQDGFNPCNKCANCLAIDKNQTTDFVELDAASNNGVNEVRSIIEAIKYFPSQLKYKIYIIDEAHMLTSGSWNALLKTIEEPPAYVVFIFATTEYNKIPATIISRCQRYDFNKISNDNLSSLIKTVAKQEKIKITNNAIEEIAHMSDGAARDALSLLDQLVNYDHNEINEETISDLFGVLKLQTKIDFLNYIFSNQQNKVLALIDQYNSSGINFELLVNDLLEILMDKIIYLRTQDEKLLSILNQEDIAKILFDNEQIIMQIIDILMKASVDIKQYCDAKFAFSFSIIKIFNLFQQTSTPSPETKKTVSINTTNNNYDKPTITSSPTDKPTTENSSTNNLTNVFLTKDVTEKYLKKSQIIKQNQWKQLSETNTVDNKLNKDFIEQKNNNLKENKSSEVIIKEINSYNEAFKQDFFAIACNQEIKLKDEFNKKFNTLKDLSATYDSPIDLLLAANKFLIVSNNGAVLLFDTKTQAMKFNKYYKNNDIRKFIVDKFGSEKIIIGIDKKQVLIYKDEFKKINKNDFKDVKIIKNQDITKTKLLEILNDDE